MNFFMGEEKGEETYENNEKQIVNIQEKNHGMIKFDWLMKTKCVMIHFDWLIKNK